MRLLRPCVLSLLLRFSDFFNPVPFDIAVVQTEKVYHALSVQVAVMLGFDRLGSASFLDNDFPMSHTLSNHLLVLYHEYNNIRYHFLLSVR